MTFSAKELEVLYMTLFNSIFSYALEFHLQDESDFDSEYKEKLELMRKINIPTATVFEAKLLELLKGGA